MNTAIAITAILALAVFAVWLAVYISRQRGRAEVESEQRKASLKAERERVKRDEAVRDISDTELRSRFHGWLHNDDGPVRRVEKNNRVAKNSRSPRNTRPKGGGSNSKP